MFLFMKRGTVLGCLLLIFTHCFAQKIKSTMPRLPLVIMPAPDAGNMPLVLMITGDGGWGRLGRRLAKQFSKENIPLVALSSWRYFRKKKTPDITTKTVESILEKYMQQWHRHSFILTGYSFGADIMPFVVNRLPDSLLKHCAGITLFSPGTTTDFKIHILQLLGSRHQWRYNVVNEIQAMRPVKTLFFFGEKEHDFPYKIISRDDWQLIYLKGGHTYGKERADMAKIILKRLDIE